MKNSYEIPDWVRRFYDFGGIELISATETERAYRCADILEMHRFATIMGSMGFVTIDYKCTDDTWYFSNEF